MSTEWHFFAFDDAAFRRHVLEPLSKALAAGDAGAWTRLLAELEEVHPASRLSRHGIYGTGRPVTDVQWYAGEPALELEAAPGADARSVKALKKVCLEALASFHLAGSCPRPTGVFWEHGFPEQLGHQPERSQFDEAAALLFCRKEKLPAEYAFLAELNQGVSVLLPPQVAQLERSEAKVGLWRRLATEWSSGEWADLAKDLQSFCAFLTLAATEGLAVYYREDAT